VNSRCWEARANGTSRGVLRLGMHERSQDSECPRIGIFVRATSGMSRSLVRLGRRSHGQRGAAGDASRARRREPAEALFPAVVLLV
jgi:hypothetical protein